MPEDYYRELALEDPPLLWVPDNTNPPRNVLNEKDDFEKNWKSYVNEHVENIEIWFSRVRSKEEACIAETWIQSRLSNDFLIGYYETRQTWLGKPSANINEIHSSSVESQCNCTPEKPTCDLIQRIFAEKC